MELAILDSRPIKSRRYIPVPETIYSKVSVPASDGDGNPSVVWNYDEENDLVVISNEGLRDQYQLVDISSLFDKKNNGDRDIRPPKKVNGDRFPEEGRVFYLVYDVMIEGETRAAYVLNTDQMSRLLPHSDDDGSSKVSVDAGSFYSKDMEPKYDDADLLGELIEKSGVVDEWENAVVNDDFLKPFPV